MPPRCEHYKFTFAPGLGPERLELTAMPHFDFMEARLHYETLGSGPPWILHHGFGQLGPSWTVAGWTDALTDRFTVVLLDALGHGRSDRGGNLDGYLIPSHGRAVAALAEHLGFGTFGLIGFSLGGRAALELAASRHAALAGAVVIGMKARMTDEDLDRAASSVRALRSGRIRSLRGDRSGPEENDAESLALTMEGVAHWRGVWDRIDRVQVPVLMVCGEGDPYHDGAREAADAMPRGEFVGLPGTDHGDSFDLSHLSLPSVIRFMSCVPGRQASACP